MSTEDIRQAETNAEAALLATADAKEAERRALLWQTPFLADRDIPDALNIPPTLWAVLKASGDGPPLFVLGRRVMVRTSDLKEWLDAKAAVGTPGVKRLRAQRKATEEAA